MKRPAYSARELGALAARWRSAWPEALATWSKFTRLHDARLCESTLAAAQEGLSGSFAMIRLADQSVVVDLEAVSRLGLDDYAVEILAHEIGHHVLAPASATDQIRLLARFRRALPTLEHHAPLAANLYTDLFINDRLQRQAGLRMADIYRALAASPAGADAQPSRLWALYMGIYEHLWKLDRGSLGAASDDECLNTDAWLGARLIRVYAAEWMDGAGRFAALVLPYLVDTTASEQVTYLHDTHSAALGCQPSGGLDIEADEVDGIVHPADDPLISGLDDAASTTQPEAAAARSIGQAREPFEYGGVLRASGIVLSDHEIAVRYYRERALPHLVPFATRQIPAAPEPQLEGLETWEIGDPLDQIDWLQSLLHSPRVIPGLTTMQRMVGLESGTARDFMPVDLDMYVDSSGSMPNPQRAISYLALAGAIIALSALRAGSSVQVTLWSGKNEHMHTPGFVRDEDQILRVLTGFYGGATCFPIHQLRASYSRPRPRPTHILMISDEGITTMFDRDNHGNSGWEVAARALANGNAGGTMALNLLPGWDDAGVLRYLPAYSQLRRARTEQGWSIHAVSRFEDLVEFARAFSRRHYSAPTAAAQAAQP